MGTSATVTEPIVVGIDESEAAEQAAAWAAGEAALRHLDVRIVLACGSAVLDSSHTRHRQERGYWREEHALARAAAIVRHTAPGTEVLTELTPAPVLPTLTAWSKRASMIVVGSHGRGPIRRAVLGSVSTAVAREAFCPVAIVYSRPPRRAGTGPDPVVVGIRDMPDDATALDYAFTEARLRESGVVAVHALRHDTAATGGQVATRETFERALSRWQHRYPEVALETVVASDAPAPALARHAAVGGLLVLGRHGWWEFEQIETDIARIAKHTARCPTLIVPDDLDTRRPSERAESVSPAT